MAKADELSLARQPFQAARDRQRNDGQASHLIKYLMIARMTLSRYWALSHFLTLALGFWLSGAAHGASPADSGLCVLPGAAEFFELDSTLPTEADGATYLSADQAEATNRQLFNFSGDVLLRRPGQELRADRTTYDAATETVDAQGNIRYRRKGLELRGSAAHLELATDEGNIEDLEYRLAAKHARGDAERMTLKGRDLAELKDARYTTCVEGNDDWYLNSSDIELNQAEGVGTARNVWVEFKDVPIFYFPYLTFPLNDERKSGFLTPSLGNSDEVGIDLLTPYYWNIAPHYDATITPRITSKRGLHLLSEFRYLQPTYSGQLDLGYLPHDDVRDEDRLGVSYRHRATFGPRWNAAIDYNYVTDVDYFEELGSSLSVASITHLEQRGELGYRGDLWSAIARVQGFQTLDESLVGISRPYDRLPQLLLNAFQPRGFYGTNYGLSGEYVFFERAVGVTGQRIDIEPTISRSLQTPAAFITPALSVRHTSYLLQDEAPGASGSPSRTLPIFSLDSGLFLERDINFGSRKLLQTLEPRLFYLHVPLRDQSDFPVFDSDQLDFNFTRLFQTNRFVGADRVGDANQATLALTTRLAESDTGVERLNASIGQIYYFRDRLVTLPGQAVDTDKVSDIIAELSTPELIRNWSARATIQWDPEAGRTARGNFAVRYQPGPDRFVSAGYRLLREGADDVDFSALQRDELSQTDLIALWPLAANERRRWNGVARWNYSLEEQRTLEALVGVEYDTCCYAVRVAGRRFINDINGDSNNSIFLQLELKGLTTFGVRGERGLQGLLESSISDNPGYQFNR